MFNTQWPSKAWDWEMTRNALCNHLKILAFRIKHSSAKKITVVSLCTGTLCVKSSTACRMFWLVQGNFRLDVETGEFTDSEILVMLGENGTGKTTFIRMIAGLAPPDEQEGVEIPQFNVSYKPQKISPKFPGTVSPFILQSSFNLFIHYLLDLSISWSIYSFIESILSIN